MSMRIFVRQVQMTKWSCILANDADFTSLQKTNFHHISADPLTKDMGTTDNTLSIWEVSDTSKKSIGEVALALIVGQAHINRMAMMWFSIDSTIDTNIQIKNTPGRSKLTDMNSYHYDIINLNYSSILPVVALFATALYKKQYMQFLKDDMTELLLSAISSQRIYKKDLPTGIQDDIDKYISKHHVSEIT